jgi:hypothetical protein
MWVSPRLLLIVGLAREIDQKRSNRVVKNLWRCIEALMLHSCLFSPRKFVLAAQFVEQRLGVLQVGRVEAFGEPAVNLGEHRARFFAAILLASRPGVARRGAQLR